MKLATTSEVPVYTVSGSSTARQLPEWLIRKRKRSLKQDPEFADRITLLQDFEFEEASCCVRVSEDGDWVMSTGTYKPQIHTHNLPNLALSFTRHTDALNETFILLSSDYSKSLHLQADRFLEFHTPMGLHYSTRIPRYGRDLKYDRRSTEALITSAGVNENGMGEVFRLNLELGRFMKGYEIEVGGDDFTTIGGGSLQGGVHAGSVNAAAMAEESHNLLGFGTSLGTVEFWDPRSRSRVGILPLPQDEGKSEVTTLEFHRSGLSFATGTTSGLIYLYDLRSPVPLLKKDQGYGYPIKNLIFLTPSSSTRAMTSEPKILSADKRIIKLWDTRDGTPWTSVEPAVDLNHVAWCPDSGMFLTANEGRQQHAFFIPQLGPAPKWCALLDNLVEEMAEDPNDPHSYNAKGGEIYDNYKFLTVAQLRQLNMDHLVGRTSLLRPYMHGYFVNQHLYEQARLIANPEVWEEQRAKSIQDKIDKERESRIRGSKKIQVKVNRRLVERIMEREEKNQRRKAKRVLARGGDDEVVDAEIAAAKSIADQDGEDQAGKSARRTLLNDPRFARLFEDPDFQVDEESYEFQQHNPSTKIPKGLTAVEEEELAERPASSSDESSSESEDDRRRPPPREKDDGRISSASYKKSGHQHQKPKMTVTSSSTKKFSHGRDKSFGLRVATLKERGAISKGRAEVVGEKEMTFIPSNRGKQIHREAEQQIYPVRNRQKDRRSASGNVFRRM